MKCFLSHSSQDKNRYVSLVAQRLSPDIEYDETTFQSGQKTEEAIKNALVASDLFVLFLSETALDSENVQKEIAIMESLLQQNSKKSLVPIVIDRSIRYDDERIPNWISETYNLRPVTRPTKAVQIIKQRRTEASWDSHPILRERATIFVGRNSLIEKFEQRFDDHDKPTPVAVITSGLREIGRKSLMRRALIKSNRKSPSYEPRSMMLGNSDGIEGFLHKLLDLMDFPMHDLPDLWHMPMDKKIDFALKQLSLIREDHEIILIDDHRCIVNDNGDIADWFLQICETPENNQLTFCIASSKKPNRTKYIRNMNLFFMNLSELERVERRGLFRRYCELLKITLSPNDFNTFADLLSGYPDQALFSAQLIQSSNSTDALSKTNEIVKFNENKASIYLKRYDDKPDAYECLRFFCGLEFFSLDLLKRVKAKVDLPITDFLDDFLANMICEHIENIVNYYRVNDVIKDFVLRGRAQNSKRFANALTAVVDDVYSNDGSEHIDISEYGAAARESLRVGDNRGERFMIPAYFLQTMRQLYDESQYSHVVALADRALANIKTFDDRTIHDLRYFLCQSLARQQDRRFVTEVQFIDGPEHNFLFGFYYRLAGRFEEAKERLSQSIDNPKTAQRSKGELVMVLIALEDFDQALSMAKDNHLRHPSNPILAQAYVNCLSHQGKSGENKAEMSTVIERLEILASDQAKEIKDMSKARFEAMYGSSTRAIQILEATTETYSSSVYPILTMLEISLFLNMPEKMHAALENLKSKVGQKGRYRFAITKAEIKLAALRNNEAKALSLILIKQSLRNITVQTKG